MSKESRKIVTKHSEIAEYWKDRCITENGLACADTVPIPSIPVVVDCGEPRCFACGELPKKIDDDDSYEKALNEGWKKIWDLPVTKSFLNRCHIVPHMFDGKDEPKNMFLLCERCHIESPDTENPRNFLKWVYKQRKRGLSVNGIFINEFFEKFLEDCREKRKDPKTMKPKEAIVGLHGNKASESSMYMALADTCDSLTA